ncbi:MAG: PKD domain-containing protein [Flavipsychrobacter sp.]|nr:PKD domain-containing protein [Flavipsychrobacter sp.]
MKRLLLILIAIVVAQITFACSASFTYSTTALGNNLLYLTCNVTSSMGSVPPASTAYISFSFGDGSYQSSGLGGSVSHNYAAAGTYSVQEIITVMDSGTFICSDTVTHSVTVSYAPCASSFTSVTGAGGSVTFTAINPAGTSGLTFLWFFGDGSYGYGNPITHTYTSNGIYSVNMYDSTSGCSYQNTGSASVTTASAGSSCAGSHALFTSSVSGLTVSFTNTSTYSGFSATPVASWWFSDGGTSTLLSPTHTFASSGTYTATLKMSWFDSLTLNTCTDTISQTVTCGSPINSISGNILIDSTGNPMNPTFKVWLINFDSATNSLSAVDSVNVIGSFWSGNYTFSNESAGSYRVKAALTNGPTSGTAAVPTYGYDSLYWHGANVISYSGYGINGANDIHLLNGTVTSGPGFVSGNVSAGANKGTQTTGMPVANLTIFLENMSSKVLAYTITDASGNYHFSNFPTGSYKIYPEDLGYITAPAILTVGTTQITNADFMEHTISKTITPISEGLVNITESTASFNVFPNPANSIVNISWTSKTALKNANVCITDVVGRRIFDTDLDMSNYTGYTHINLSSLTSGVYFISIKADGINYTNKVVLQH